MPEYLPSEKAHPRGIQTCSVYDEGREPSQELADLQSCPSFQYVEEYRADAAIVSYNLITAFVL